jgi:hypothetical protein
VEECEDQGGIDIVALADIVPIDRLPGYIGRKVGPDGGRAGRAGRAAIGSQAGTGGADALGAMLSPPPV